MFKIAASAIIAKAISGFSSSKKAKELGINDNALDEISKYLKDDLTFNSELEKEIIQEVEKARHHDLLTSKNINNIVNNIRGIVRPLCTLIAFSWYIYAKLNSIDLNSQDYSIIGGTLAFWFGFRSYEKKNGIF